MSPPAAITAVAPLLHIATLYYRDIDFRKIESGSIFANKNAIRKVYDMA